MFLQSFFRDAGILNGYRQTENKKANHTNRNNAVQVINTLNHLARCLLNHGETEYLSDVEILVGLLLQLLGNKPAGDDPAKAIQIKAEEDQVFKPFEVDLPSIPGVVFANQLVKCEDYAHEEPNHIEIVSRLLWQVKSYLQTEYRVDRNHQYQDRKNDV